MGTGKRRDEPWATPWLAKDKKRGKLGYTRTSIACVPCRQRKMRCILQESGLQTRCRNCIRMKKKCVFRPVAENNTVPSGTSSTINTGLEASALNAQPSLELDSMRPCGSPDHQVGKIPQLLPDTTAIPTHQSWQEFPRQEACASLLTVPDTETAGLPMFHPLETFVQTYTPSVTPENVTLASRRLEALVNDRLCSYGLPNTVMTITDRIASSSIDTHFPLPAAFDGTHAYTTYPNQLEHKSPSGQQTQVSRFVPDALEQQQQESRDYGSRSTPLRCESLFASTTLDANHEAQCNLDPSLNQWSDTIGKLFSTSYLRHGQIFYANVPDAETVHSTSQGSEVAQADQTTGFTSHDIRGTSMELTLQSGVGAQAKIPVRQSCNEPSPLPSGRTPQPRQALNSPGGESASEFKAQPQLPTLSGPCAKSLEWEIERYWCSLWAIFAQLRAGDFCGMADRLMHIVRYLRHHASKLELTNDDIALRSIHSRLWDGFNRAWLTTLQHQHDLTQELLRDDRLPMDIVPMINVKALERLAEEIIQFSDELEKFGLVDYEIGIAEEEIIQLLIRCYDSIRTLNTQRH